MWTTVWKAMNRNRHFRAYLGATAVVLGLLAFGLGSGLASAQNTGAQVLLDRIDRLQRELNTLQGFVYRGRRPAGRRIGARTAPPAANSSLGTGMDPRLIARMDVRLTELETQLRTLTGQNEEMAFSVVQLSGRLDKLIADVDFRLRALERGRPGVPGGAWLGPGSSAAFQPPEGAAPSVSRVLGLIPLSALDGNRPAVAAAPAQSNPALPQGSQEERYRYAMSLLRQQNFPEAERAFRAFVVAHGKHKLASNAQYWLGETYYVRKEYQQAAFAFAEGFQTYPNSKKAPDNLLKLAMSLAQLGKRREACTAFTRLNQNFPKASTTIKRRVTRERTRLACR